MAESRQAAMTSPILHPSASSGQALHFHFTFSYSVISTPKFKKGQIQIPQGDVKGKQLLGLETSIKCYNHPQYVMLTFAFL
jgi:hypothetical protein